MLLIFSLVFMQIVCLIAKDAELNTEVIFTEEETNFTLTSIDKCPLLNHSSSPPLERFPRLYDILYFCPLHYRLEGPIFRECHHGRWHPPDESQCVRICPENMTKPQYLHMAIANNLTDLWIMCTLSSSRPTSNPDQNCCHEYEATAQLYQDKRLPRCNISCQSPNAPGNGSLIFQWNKTISEKAKAEADCFAGFELVPPESKVRHCFDGEWTGTDPACRPLLPDDNHINARLYWGVVVLLIVAVISMALTSIWINYRSGHPLGRCRLLCLNSASRVLPMQIHLQPVDNTYNLDA